MRSQITRRMFSLRPKTCQKPGPIQAHGSRLRLTVKTHWAPSPPRASILPLFTCLLLSGCLQHLKTEIQADLVALNARQDDIEKTLDVQALENESVVIGLEKLVERVDVSYPASAQWLRFESGATVRWYIDEKALNLFAQFVRFDSESGQVTLMLRSQAGEHPGRLRAGESLEVLLPTEDERRTLVITLHRLLFRADGTCLGLLSMVEGLPEGI